MSDLYFKNVKNWRAGSSCVLLFITPSFMLPTVELYAFTWILSLELPVMLCYLRLRNKYDAAI